MAAVTTLFFTLGLWSLEEVGGAAYRCANTTDVLYLPHVLGGLGLPVLASLYKQHQVSRQCILLMSSDLCV